MKRPRRAGGARNLLGAVLIGAVMLALAGFVAAAVVLRAPPIDAETLCRTDQPLAAHTIVLIDATDRLEPRHRRKVRAVLAQERERLGQFGRLTLMRVNARRPQEPVVLFSKCLPRPPDQANPWFENARQVQARWDEAFGAALDEALRHVVSGGGARASPIVASVRAAAADPEFDAAIPRRRLVLVSDLLEHNPQGFSTYGEAGDYGAWRAQNASDPPDLSHVDLRIAPLDRPDFAARQAAALDRFWPAFFDATDVQSLTIDPMP